MFESYRKLKRFKLLNASATNLSLEQKLAMLDGMVKHARALRPDLFEDDLHGLKEKIAFIKLLHGVRGTAG